MTEAQASIDVEKEFDREWTRVSQLCEDALVRVIHKCDELNKERAEPQSKEKHSAPDKGTEYIPLSNHMLFPKAFFYLTHHNFFVRYIYEAISGSTFSEQNESTIRQKIADVFDKLNADTIKHEFAHMVPLLGENKSGGSRALVKIEPFYDDNNGKYVPWITGAFLPHEGIDPHTNIQAALAPEKPSENDFSVAIYLANKNGIDISAILRAKGYKHPEEGKVGLFTRLKSAIVNRA